MINFIFHPLLPKTPCNWLSAAIQGAASNVNTIISGAVDLANTNRTNDTNWAIAQLNNEREIQLWHEQQEHDLNMWNLQNAYNTPLAQRQRYEEAGYNPLNMTTESGNATSSAGGQTPPELESPVMQKSNIGSILASQSPLIAQFGNLTAQERLNNANASGKEIQNSVDSATSSDLIKRLQSLSTLDSAHAKVANDTIHNEIELSNQRVKSAQQEFELLQYQTKNAEWLAAKTRYEVLNLQPQQAAINEQMLLNMSQELKNMMLNGELTKANIQKVFAERASLLASIQIGWFNAQSNRISANAQQQQADNGTLLSTSQSALLDSQTTAQNTENKYKDNLLRLNTQVLGINVKNLIKEGKLLDKKNQSYWFDKGMDYLESLSRSFYNTASGVGNIKALTAAPSASAPASTTQQNYLNGYQQNINYVGY